MALIGAIAVVVAAIVFLFAVERPVAGATALLGLIITPLFVDIGTGSLTILRLRQQGGSDESETGLPIFLPFLAMLFVLALQRRRNAGRVHLVPRRAVGLLAITLTVSVMVGYGLSGAGSLGFVYYLQTMIPLMAWFVGYRVSVPAQKVSRTVVSATLVTLGLLLVIIFFFVGSIQPLAVIKSLSAVIPQYRNYYPLVVVCGVAFAICGFSWHPRLSVAFGAVFVVFLPFLWSRTGLGMILVAGAVAYVLRSGRNRMSARILLGAPVGAFVGYAVIVRVLSGVVGERQANSVDISGSDNTRVQLIDEAFNRLLSRPLLGDMFVPSQAYTAGGKVAERLLLFPAHNQYLDMALRGGVVAAAALIALLVGYFLDSARRSQSGDADSPFFGAIAAIVAAVAFGNFFQLYVIQPWTGSLLMILLGTATGIASRDSSFSSQTATTRRAGRTPRRRVGSAATARR